MKLVLVLSIISIFFSFGYTISRETKIQNSKQPKDCTEIIDSVNVFVKHGPFSLNWEQRDLNEGAALRIMKWFQQRPFSELLCLLKSSNKLHNMYGFVVAGENYLDSLKAFQYLFDDTTSFQVHTPDGMVKAPMSVGTFISQMYSQMLKSKEDFDKQPLIQEKVSAFIRQYATYPDTYVPDSFPSFSIAGGLEDRTSFSIRHFYKLKNNDRSVRSTTSEFVFDTDLNLMVIATDSTRYFYSDPPILSGWLREFGRRLDKTDSVALKLR